MTRNPRVGVQAVRHYRLMRLLRLGASPATRHKDHTTGTRHITASQGMIQPHHKSGTHVPLSTACAHAHSHLLRAPHGLADIAARVHDREQVVTGKEITHHTVHRGQECIALVRQGVRLDFAESCGRISCVERKRNRRRREVPWKAMNTQGGGGAVTLMCLPTSSNYMTRHPSWTRGATYK